MFLARLRLTWQFCLNNILCHIPLLQTFVLAPYKLTFITYNLFIKLQLCMLSRRISHLVKQNVLPFICFSELRVCQMSKERIPYYFICIMPTVLERFYLFGFIISFTSFLFYSITCFLLFWENITSPNQYTLPHSTILWNCIC